MNRLSRPSRSFVFALTAAIALVVSACGGGGDEEGAGGGGDAPDTLAVSIGAEPGSLDPLLISDGQSSIYQWSVYEGLTARNGSEVEPLLATEWELDGTSWIFTLREGVTFHNGEPLTAADVVASYERVFGEGGRLSFLVEDTVVEAVDDSTVSITRPVADPSTPLRASLIAIAPAEYADLSSDRLITEQMGTGPYKFDGWERTQEITLSAYEDYWGEQPAIERISIQFDEEEAVRLASLQTGEIDMALNMPADLASDEFEVAATPVSEIAMVRLNSLAGPFADERVRLAAALAINRDLIIEQVYGGYAEPATQAIAPYVFGFNPDLEPREFDPERARQLLEEAGAAGAPVELMGSRGRWTSDAQLGEALAAMLRDVGFTVELQQPPFTEWLEVWFDPNDAAAPEMVLVNHSNELFESAKSVQQLLTCEGESSATCFPELNELALQALDEPDEEQRQLLYEQVFEIAHERILYLTIAEVPRLSFLDEGLEWDALPGGFLLFQDMRFAA